MKEFCKYGHLKTATRTIKGKTYLVCIPCRSRRQSVYDKKHKRDSKPYEVRRRYYLEFEKPKKVLLGIYTGKSKRSKVEMMFSRMDLTREGYL